MADVDIEHALAEFIEGRQIPIFGVASADGFEYALPDWKPRELMPRCKSVVLFGRSFEHLPYVVNGKHIAAASWWEANEPVFRQVARWRGEIVNLFDQFGLATANFGGYGPTEPPFSYRLAQVEAGIGVCGRFGVCLNPDFGCHYTVGVLLTETDLSPTDEGRLEDFSPCEDCAKCAEVCSVRGIDPSNAPVTGYDRDLCLRFILRMKERHGANAKMCARCFSACPWGWRKQASHQLCEGGVQQ